MFVIEDQAKQGTYDKCPEPQVPDDGNEGNVFHLDHLIYISLHLVLRNIEHIISPKISHFQFYEMIYYVVTILVSFGIYWMVAVAVLSVMGLIESYNTVSRCNNWMLYVYCTINLMFMFYWVTSMATCSESLSSFVVAMIVMGMAYVYVTVMHNECFDTDLVEIVIVQISTEICCLCARVIYDRCLKHRLLAAENHNNENVVGL